MTVGVLEAAQAINAVPSEFLPKHVALRLVNRGWADRISKALIRKRLERRSDAEAERVTCSQYIPDKMPPREVPGCFFQQPQSDTWRIQHRTVQLIAG